MSHLSRVSLKVALVVLVTLSSLPAQTAVMGEVGPSFTESSAAVFAGALQMATVEPSSGVLRASIGIAYPAARGAAQPGLGLYYSSASGIREAGMGWGLNLPAIERRGPTGGPPVYGGDPPPERDPYVFSDGLEASRYYGERMAQFKAMSHFVFNGEPLVPLCEVESHLKPCTTADSAVLPDWAGKGWIYFRLEEDTTFARFFWSPDRKTWRVQLRGGEVLELGRATVVPLPGDEFATEYDVRFGGNLGHARHVRADGRLPLEAGAPLRPGRRRGAAAQHRRLPLEQAGRDRAHVPDGLVLHAAGRVGP